MELYSPKRGTYVSDAAFQQVAERAFHGSTTGTYTTSVEAADQMRSVSGYIISSENPLLNGVAAGVIDMGNRKDWVHLQIDHVDETAELVQITSDADNSVLETAATAKNVFLAEVTGYDVQDLTNKANNNARDYDSLSDL